MQFGQLSICLIASGVAATQLVSIAEARTPDRMMQECRTRAHEIMHVRLPDVDTKYEGQRTDGTHAVNGTAWIRARTETFQCSFDRSGREIVQFLVNQPSEPEETQLPEPAEPVTRTENIRLSGAGYKEYTGNLNPGDSVRYVFNGGNRKFLNLHLLTRNKRVYVNVFTPDGNTLHESARAGNDYLGQLWLDGEHIVEVSNRGRRAASYKLGMALEH